MDQEIQEASSRIDDALNHLKRELSSIRAGRANPSLIEEVPVSAYGTKMKLMELGSITAPQPSLLTIQVWDAALVNEIQKAILEANLGLNPAVEGQTVRLPIPPLTEERRQEFVKLSRKHGEDTKIEIRQIRADVRTALQKAKEAGEISEDELNRKEKFLQDLIEISTNTVDGQVKVKEQELMTI
ncbi:MAG: Ribosome recycling factor [Candidatus Daviesbacteria bacterium GW2011_GWA2_38_24]|uniref:Ribosome-recycling factor n=1 Tax=Candidatus Daviesbacteria bacterium GW2011_GWA2_38_24 TaxID=1618422 RepID=A0A0G0JEA8_9BACT|nr:MAG: Ribosome recycling factor [Candidatus Daviesbacteria bacterium GW2011_GWA2_38_24]KKQ80984.1 MAG: Ribosome recycling factor [Candidatus Daviesbacteria bacterium GW2011_GWA1_38_7]